MADGWDKYQTLVLDKLDTLERNIMEIKVDNKTFNTRVGNIEKIEIENAANLSYHIKRTDVAEQRIEVVEKRLEEEVKELRHSIVQMQLEMKREMQSTRDAVQGWKANLSLLGWLFSAVTIIAGILLRFYNF
jgi:hypothetical protein